MLSITLQEDVEELTEKKNKTNVAKKGNEQESVWGTY